MINTDTLNRLEEAMNEGLRLDYIESEDIISVHNGVEAIKELAKNDPEALIKWCDSTLAWFDELYIENNICPICGGSIEYKRYPAYDTYVPYGSTYVLESEGYRRVCDSCGEVYDD